MNFLELKNPGEMPPRLTAEWWKRVALAGKLAVIDFMVDNGPHWAAAMAFYTLLSAFPLMLGIIAVASVFVDPAWATQQLAANLGDFVPQGEGEVERIVESAFAAGGGAGVSSVIILLWSGSWVFGSLTTALNMAYDVDEPYSFWKRLLFRLGLMLSVGGFMVIAVASGPVIRIVMSQMGDPTLLTRAISAVVPFVLMVAAFFLVYWLVPRRKVAWVPSLTGAVLATIAFIASREAFVAYLSHWGENYDVIYGSLAVGIILVFWAWIVAIILLLGAELTSHLHALMVEGLTPDEVVKRHLGRSPDHREDEAEG